MTMMNTLCKIVLLTCRQFCRCRQFNVVPRRSLSFDNNLSWSCDVSSVNAWNALSKKPENELLYLNSVDVLIPQKPQNLRILSFAWRWLPLKMVISNKNSKHLLMIEVSKKLCVRFCKFNAHEVNGLYKLVLTQVVVALGILWKLINVIELWLNVYIQ